MKFNHFLLAQAITLSVTACAYENHFIDEDEVDSSVETAYLTMENLNCANYGGWTYVNLETGETETHPDASEWIYSDGTVREAQDPEEITIDWHIAFHRYEMKTNDATVCNTGITDITAVTSLPDGTYTADETVTYEEEAAKDEAGEASYLIMTDMSNMMSSIIGYAHTATINRTLSDGITRTATGSMPPTIYGTTGEVFALRWDDGSWAKILITAVYDSSGASGYLSFNYLYYPE